MKKEITVITDEGLDHNLISISIATIGWKTTHYKVYDEGEYYTESIPDNNDQYILRIQYGDSLSSTQIYIHDDETLGSQFIFEFIIIENKLSCKITSYSYPELNKTVELKDTDTDTDEFMEQFRKRLKG